MGSGVLLAGRVCGRAIQRGLGQVGQTQQRQQHRLCRRARKIQARQQDYDRPLRLRSIDDALTSGEAESVHAMKENINPTVAAVIIVVVLAVVVFFGWKAVGPGQKTHEPQSMSQFMGGANKAMPPSARGT